MTKVIQALQEGTNALLESPTGTGKTLCLLCAALAWRRSGSGGEGGGSGGAAAQAPPNPPADAPTTWASSMRAAISAGLAGRGPSDAAPAGLAGTVAGTGRPPPLIYASRTHSQLAQVVGELKRTAYAPTAVVLGSRQQLCIHPTVSRASSAAAVNRGCAAALKKGACSFHSLHAARGSARGEAFLTSASSGAPLDVEDLSALGRATRACPFYGARALAAAAEVVLVPYAYLVDPRSRAGLKGVQWRGATVVFDEAHNLEGAASEAASFDLPAAVLAAAVEEAGLAAAIADRRAEAGVGGVVGTGRGGGPGALAGGAATSGAAGTDASSSGAAPPDFTTLARDLRLLASLLRSLEGAIAQAAAGPPFGGRGGGGGGGGGPTATPAAPASFLFNLLSSIGITTASLPPLSRTLDDGAAVLTDGDGGGAAAMGVTSSGGGRGEGRGAALTAVADCLRLAFESAEAPPPRSAAALAAARLAGGGGPPPPPPQPASASYRVHIHTPAGAPGPTLSYWCFSPAPALAALAAAGVRSLILTSGTLAPLPGLAAELGAPFPIRLENPHVVPDANVFAAVLARGPGAIRLNSSFRTRDSAAYKADLGAAIVGLAGAVPGGMLVFFPSYGLLNAAVDAWKGTPSPPALAPHPASSLWDALAWRKAPVVEPRDATGFVGAAQTYRAALSAPGGRGAIFLAVCRGKASEGLDFSDSAARCVVVTGLPFPNVGDARVSIKRRVLDEACQAAGRKRALHPGGGGHQQAQHAQQQEGAGTALSGDAWYTQQAARAVNQAVGRCIRHVGDYGAIILADERFGEPRSRASLSAWVRRLVVGTEAGGGGYGDTAAGVRAFFGRHATTAVTTAAARRAAAGGGAQPGAIAPSWLDGTRGGGGGVLSLARPADAAGGGRVNTSGLAGLGRVSASAARARPPPPGSLLEALAGGGGRPAADPAIPDSPLEEALGRARPAAVAAAPVPWAVVARSGGGGGGGAPPPAPAPAPAAPPPVRAPLLSQPRARPVVEEVGPPGALAAARRARVGGVEPPHPPPRPPAPRAVEAAAQPPPPPPPPPADPPPSAVTRPRFSPTDYLASLRAGLPPADHATLVAALRAYRPGGAAPGDAGALCEAFLGVLASPGDRARAALLDGFVSIVPKEHRSWVAALVAASRGGGSARAAAKAAPRAAAAAAPAPAPAAAAAAAPPPPPPPAARRDANPFFRGGTLQPRRPTLPVQAAVAPSAAPRPSAAAQRPAPLYNPAARARLPAGGTAAGLAAAAAAAVRPLDPPGRAAQAFGSLAMPPVPSGLGAGLAFDASGACGAGRPRALPVNNGAAVLLPRPRGGRPGMEPLALSQGGGGGGGGGGVTPGPRMGWQAARAARALEEARRKGGGGR